MKGKWLTKKMDTKLISPVSYFSFFLLTLMMTFTYEYSVPYNTITITIPLHLLIELVPSTLEHVQWDGYTPLKFTKIFVSIIYI